MSYSTDSAEQLRRAATYIDRILKGARAADLPVQNPTTFELGDQFEDGQGDRRHASAKPARNRERGHRVGFGCDGRHGWIC